MPNALHSYNTKKQRQYQGLNEKKTYLYDTSLLSPNYFNLSNIPTILTAGKNVFKLKANNQTLKIGSNILVEALDQNGNTIYTETSDYIDRNNNRVIILYIYADTPPGISKLTILGQATIDLISAPGQIKPIPSEWLKSYNIKWTYSINVNPLKRNESEIIFQTEPKVILSEVFKKQNVFQYIKCNVDEVLSGNISYYNSLSHYGLSYTNIPNIMQGATNFGSYQTLYTKYSNGIESKAGTNVQEFRNSETPLNQTSNLPTKPATNNSFDSKHGMAYNNISSPTLILNQLNPAHPFRFFKDMEGGIINIDQPLTSIVDLPENYSFVSNDDAPYNAVITKVLNANTIFVNKPYTRSIIGNGKNVIQQLTFNKFIPSQFEVTYSSKYITNESEAYRNFAVVDMANLNTLSGDIFRIKPYVRSITDASDFVPMTDVILESTNILITTSSYAINEPLGVFQNQQFINSYWDVYSSSIEQAQLTYDNIELIDGCKISSTSTPLSSGYWEMTHISQSNVTLYKNNLYKISFNIVGYSENSNTPELLIICSGSAFDNDNKDNFTGGYIGKIKLNNPFNIYKDLTFDIIPDRDGDAQIKFFIKGGTWILSNIQLFALKEDGFSPSNTSFLIPLKPIWDGDVLDFKFEFYDYKGNMCNQILYINNVKFDNGYSHYMQGNYNLITGSAWVGKQPNTGLQITGQSSGIIKSVGYLGYQDAIHGGAPGFILWSGSFVLDATGSYPTSYSGVGIELHGGTHTGSKMHALHFDTDTGILQITGSIVATDAVFQDYAIADYLGSRILVISDSNKINYLFDFTYSNLSWSYLDLSAAYTDSGMFIRFETYPNYPLTHMLVPAMYSFMDNQVGGDITLEFIDNKPIADRTYFATLTGSFIGTDYVPQVPLLVQSNAIRNYSGSLVYGGFNELSDISSSIMDWTGSYSKLLSGRRNARYIWTKGSSGFGITSATNYDKTSFALLNATITKQTGTRRNDWIPPQNIFYSDALASASTTIGFDISTGLNYLNISGTLTAPVPPQYDYESLYFSFIVPEYIIDSKVTCYLYCLSPHITDSNNRIIFQNPQISAISASIDGMIASFPAALNNISTTGIPIINPIQNIITAGWIKFFSGYVNSGDICHCMTNIRLLNIPDAQLYGIRIAYDTNTWKDYGGFDSPNNQGGTIL